MQNFTLRVRDFRVLERLDWSPAGVCILAGANGTGKSTTLDIFRFLRALFVAGHEAAFRAAEGVSFQRLGAGTESAVEFMLTVDNLSWKLIFPTSAHGLKGIYGEEVVLNGRVMLRAAMYEDSWYFDDIAEKRDEQRCCAKQLWDRGMTPWLKPLADLLGGIRIYSGYWLHTVKRVESTLPSDLYLHHTGKNIWPVLANWKASPRLYAGQFDWVMMEARKAFPGLIGSIEFDRGQPYLFGPHTTDASDGLPPNRVAEGLLTGLLHLTAVAGAKNGSLIAFDEMENQLHPHAIRSLIASMRRRAEDFDLTIVLTTHSPVVLNQFLDEPEQVFVLGHDESDLPVPAAITELHDEDWIAQTKLGTLYERLAFGAPRIERLAFGAPKNDQAGQ